MTFSVTPFKGSLIEKAAALINISTVSSKEHFLKGDEYTLLIPFLEIAINFPYRQIASANNPICLWFT